LIRISRLADYASLLLAHLVTCTDEPVHTARDLADQCRLPYPTVSKILKVLVRGGLLVSQRGIKGGYRLARSPEQITIAQIIEAVEGPIAITECSVHVNGACELESCCEVRSNWLRINELIVTALESITLVDLAKTCTPQSPLVRIGRDVEEKSPKPDAS